MKDFTDQTLTISRTLSGLGVSADPVAVKLIVETVQEACEAEREVQVRAARAEGWEEGYAKACRDHGGYTSCGTGPDPHNASHTNPYKENP